MKKIIKLSESELEKIVSMVLNEQQKFDPLTGPGTFYGTYGPKITAKDNSKLSPKADINPKKLKLGDGGSKNPKQIQDVKILQQKLMDLGHLVISKPTGYFGSLTQKALNNYYNSGKTSGAEKKKTTTTTTSKPTENVKYSKQVQDQLNYMKNSGILKNEKFTLLDDKNSIVYAFLPGYKFYKLYYVITGKNKGDALKTKTMTDWIWENWRQVGSYIWKQVKGVGSWKDLTSLPDRVADYIDGCYFNSSDWVIKNTPSGVFKRAGTISNYMNDLLATTFVSEDYGDRFITWETCEGKTIPFGFHGTLNPQRLKVLDNTNPEKVSCQRRKMSFGCINFNAKDVNDINNFISSGQLTIWLPDKTNDIVEIPQNCL